MCAAVSLAAGSATAAKKDGMKDDAMMKKEAMCSDTMMKDGAMSSPGMIQPADEEVTGPVRV